LEGVSILPAYKINYDGIECFRNVVHGNDSPYKGKHEIGKFCNNSV
jgi:hypothetical protein